MSTDIDQVGEPEDGPSGAVERRQLILERLQEQEFVSVNDLADEFGVTGMSLRRDLTALAARGLLTRVRGGATRARTSSTSRMYLEAERRHATEKAQIARAAAEMLANETSAFFYSGSTVAKVVSALDESTRERLTVVTPAVPIINEVSSWNEPHLVAVGGVYLPAYMAFVGPQAVSSLANLSAEVAVMGCDGLTADEGITTPHQLVAEIGTIIVKRARKVIVVADSSKVGRRGFAHIAPISTLTTLITDSGADPEELAALKAGGVDVVVV
ncbi:DeoR/GlpR transcriptional regulator [Nocardioides mangrovicus]|uniref:DeoR/GlpR transcriptional regulator n=1 Tax=Nocardioides mangrovicus TaxID=2478913 RepID=A0A3L8P4R9_9ACTN|nr:DeoR/GlpR family DNA-binding transcription regulator [Nocardioides mangrovicus]RLV49743.1 DeoR/GlpR transcriptional regulator [Nocardioides mangrovicus]